MVKIQEMIDSKKKKWGDQVRVIGLSIDQDWTKNKQSIAALGLTGMEHYNVKNDACKVSQYFGVKQIPYCALINKDGKIAFIGHPNWRRLDEDIAALTKGKTITGRGTESFLVSKEKEWN